MFILEASARLTGADPAVLDAGQAALVVRYRANDSVPRLDDSLVPDDENEKTDAWHGQRPQGNVTTPDKDCGRDGEGEHAKPADR
jgi:hypothetical protein